MPKVMVSGDGVVARQSGKMMSLGAGPQDRAGVSALRRETRANIRLLALWCDAAFHRMRSRALGLGASKLALFLFF